MMVANGRMRPPREWYDTDEEKKAADVGYLNNRLSQMMARNLPRGYQ